MNKNIIFRLLRIITIIFVICGVFYLYIPPIEGKIETMNTTVGENTVDILCVGSSHMFSGINPIQLYEEYGYSAYVLAAGSQAPWQSYYYIKEANKTQNPQIVIFDTYILGTMKPEDFQDYQTVSNMLYFKNSYDKLCTIMESTADSKLNIILRFPYVYNRTENYSGLSINKLYGRIDYSMGYSYSTAVESYDKVLDVNNIIESVPLDSKNEKYLRLIIEYCREKEIALILTNTPWPCITEESQKKFNEIKRIVTEYNIEFIDGCLLYKEIGIDYMTDSSGDYGHLNYYGVTKYTKWIGDYIKDNYSLTDHRGNKQYNAYEEGINWLNEMKGSE